MKQYENCAIKIFHILAMEYFQTVKDRCRSHLLRDRLRRHLRKELAQPSINGREWSGGRPLGVSPVRSIEDHV